MIQGPTVVPDPPPWQQQGCQNLAVFMMLSQWEWDLLCLMLIEFCWAGALAMGGMLIYYLLASGCL